MNPLAEYYLKKLRERQQPNIRRLQDITLKRQLEEKIEETNTFKQQTETLS